MPKFVGKVRSPHPTSLKPNRLLPVVENQPLLFLNSLLAFLLSNNSMYYCMVQLVKLQIQVSTSADWQIVLNVSDININ